MAEILFTDATGAVTLACMWPAPGSRFRNWVPFNLPIGEGAHGLGDGQRYQYQFRTDHGASFELPGIPDIHQDYMTRLQAHLLGGGVCEVRTEDSLASVYLTCGLAPDSEITITYEDRKAKEYTFAAAVIDLSVSPSTMICHY